MIENFQKIFYCDGKKVIADDEICKYSLEPRAKAAQINRDDRIAKLKEKIKNDYDKLQFNKKYQVNGYNEAKIIKHYIQNEFGELAYFYEDNSLQMNKLVKIDYSSKYPQSQRQIFQNTKVPVIYVKFLNKKIPENYTYPKTINNFTYIDQDGTIKSINSLKNSTSKCNYCGTFRKLCIGCDCVSQQCIGCGYIINSKEDIKSLYVTYCSQCI